MKNKTHILMLLGVCLFHLVQAQQGLVGEYFNGVNFNEKKLTRTDAQINFVWNNVAPSPGMNANQFSVRWTGKLKAPKTGEYLFRAHVDDGIRVWVGGQKVIDAWGLHDSEPFAGKITLEAGRLYDLKVEYYNGMIEGEIQLFWQLPGDEPLFGGTFGYNDKIIDSRYFFQPEKTAAVMNAQAQGADPQRTQTEAVKPAPARTATPSTKPVAKPVAKPATQAAAKPAAQPPVQASPVSKDTLEKYIPKNIHFVKSKAEMLPESTPELDRLAGFLLRHPKLLISIEGHTDKVGDSGKNQELSENRARAVASYLVKKGVAAERITAIGYGDSRPVVKEGNDVRNRRVEFLIRE